MSNMIKTIKKRCFFVSLQVINFPKYVREESIPIAIFTNIFHNLADYLHISIYQKNSLKENTIKMTCIKNEKSIKTFKIKITVKSELRYANK